MWEYKQVIVIPEDVEMSPGKLGVQVAHVFITPILKNLDRLVDPKNTSQICSVCGKKKKTKLTLANRMFGCEHCKSSLNRDVNAAVNILKKSKRLTELAGKKQVFRHTSEN